MTPLKHISGSVYFVFYELVPYFIFYSGLTLVYSRVLKIIMMLVGRNYCLRTVVLP